MRYDEIERSLGVGSETVIALSMPSSYHPGD